MSEVSRQTGQTVYSTRANNLLEQVRQSTSFETNKEFLATLRQFKRKQYTTLTRITSQQVQEKVSKLLQNYPDLLIQFEEVIPKPQTQFTSALAFVNKVKNAYKSDPVVYETFLGLLRDFQRGGQSQTEVGFVDQVTRAVSILLSKTPDLVKEFQEFYNQKPLTASESNATLNEESIRTPHLDNIHTEETPLLARDIEAQRVVAHPRPIAFYAFLVSLNLIFVGGFLLYWFGLVHF